MSKFSKVSTYALVLVEPVLSLDIENWLVLCHLRGCFGEIMLAAVGHDANDCI